MNSLSGAGGAGGRRDAWRIADLMPWRDREGSDEKIVMQFLRIVVQQLAIERFALVASVAVILLLLSIRRGVTMPSPKGEERPVNDLAGAGSLPASAPLGLGTSMPPGSSVPS